MKNWLFTYKLFMLMIFKISFASSLSKKIVKLRYYLKLSFDLLSNFYKLIFDV